MTRTESFLKSTKVLRMVMHNWNHTKSGSMVMLKMSSGTWSYFIVIRIIPFPICSNRSIISLFLTWTKPVREVLRYICSWYCWISNYWTAMRYIYRVRTRTNRFLSCFLDKVFLSLSFVNWPIISSSWRRRVGLVSLINIVVTWTNITSIVSQPGDLCNQYTFGDLLIWLLNFIFLVKIKL